MSDSKMSIPYHDEIKSPFPDLKYGDTIRTTVTVSWTWINVEDNERKVYDVTISAAGGYEDSVEFVYNLAEWAFFCKLILHL